MKDQLNLFRLFLSFFLLFLNFHCSPANLNSTCDPNSKSFLVSALLEFGSTDGKFLCPSFGGLNPFRLHYGSDFLVVRQNEPIGPIIPFASEQVETCSSSPSLPAGLSLNESSCVISGTPLVGMNSTKYLITANSSSKQTTISLIIKSLFAPKFAYVVNTSSGLVNSYSINATTGLLNSTGFVAAGGGPESMGISPSQKYLTVPNRSSNDISQFSINQTNGSLTNIQTIASGGSIPLAMTYHPYKDIVYIRHSLNVTTFLVNQATGHLTLIGTVTASTGASSIGIDPFGNYLYVPNYNGKMIDLYQIDPASGIPYPSVIQTIMSGANPRNVEIIANGKNLYIVNDVDNNISNYQLNSNSGTMNFVSSTPALGLSARSIISDPASRFVYLTYQGSDLISVFAIDPISGSLIPTGSQSITGDGPTGITIDSSGKFLYVTNINANTADMFLINQVDGSLTSVGNVGTSTMPIAVVTAGTNP
ncbi:3-carboxymuconate cyclase [Leptospira mtsangambouensis]|uniref:3-carboxymuconate cyclase n=1 Tax=Leptospira mtsangambouensis TaxID=2484912 RepID=A0ABY2NY18_9LEPT|nr:beta-propeller fold lactonase family protein [Leptospira mtsangambouensis]TGM74025.1 3-carboxymuconate cyclase [Leptospira mtsangambouensis]